MPSHIKPKSSESRRNSFFLFFSFSLPGVDVYVCVSMLCCFHSVVSTQTFWRALTASLDSCAEIRSNGITNFGRVWRKVPESKAWSVSKILARLMAKCCPDDRNMLNKCPPIDHSKVMTRWCKMMTRLCELLTRWLQNGDLFITKWLLALAMYVCVYIYIYIYIE